MAPARIDPWRRHRRARHQTRHRAAGVSHPICAATDAALVKTFPGVRLVNFGHLGDGNLHYNVQAPDGQTAQAFMAQHTSMR